MKVLLSLCFSSSIDTNVRTRRSKTSGNQSRRQGCSLGTCTVHDLAHRLHQLSNKYKIGNAPVEKISPQGYGRRRRSLPERRVTLRLEQGRLRPVWSRAASPVHTLEALLRRTWAGLGGDRKEGRRVTQSKILQMHLTSTEHCPEHFSRHEDWVRVRLDAPKVCSSAEPHGSAQWCQRGREAHQTHGHWTAKCSANSRCCSRLSGGRREIVCGKKGHVLCLKGGILLYFPQSQDFDKCYPQRIILTCSKRSEIVCTFPLGLKVI